MRYSYSNVETYSRCPYAWFLRYANRLKTLPNYDADNALAWGTAMHMAIQESYEAAEKYVYDYFPIITQDHADRLHNVYIKSILAKKLLPPNGRCEVEVSHGNDFIGFIDYLTKNDDGTYNLYDFKYTSNSTNYTGSAQLHLYKYFWERKNRRTISHMYYVFIPKNDEPPRLKEVDFKIHHLVNFLVDIKHICEADEFPKNESNLCRWCEYEDYCQKGLDYMLLPKNERRNLDTVNRRRVWIYGAPFSGKTTFANAFPDPLMLNTDGNVTFVDAPYIAIKNIVTTEGRITNVELAWKVFKDVIAELEKKDNTFKTIV